MAGRWPAQVRGSQHTSGSRTREGQMTGTGNSPRTNPTVNKLTRKRSVSAGICEGCRCKTPRPGCPKPQKYSLLTEASSKVHRALLVCFSCFTDGWEHKLGRGWERGTEDPRAGSALTARGGARTHEPWDHDLSPKLDAQPTEPPRCPECFLFLTLEERLLMFPHLSSRSSSLPFLTCWEAVTKSLCRTFTNTPLASVKMILYFVFFSFNQWMCSMTPIDFSWWWTIPCEILGYGSFHHVHEAVFCFCFKIFFKFIYFWESESQSRRKRERDIESEAGSRLRAVSTEPDPGLKPMSCEIVTWAKVGCSTDWTTQAPLRYVFLDSVVFS